MTSNVLSVSRNPFPSLFYIILFLLSSLVSPSPFSPFALFQPPVAPSPREIEEEGPSSSRERTAPVADAEVEQESPVTQGSSAEEGKDLEVRDIGNTYVVNRCITCA